MKTITTTLLTLLVFCCTLHAGAQTLETIQAMHKEKDPTKNVATLHRMLKNAKLDVEDIDLMKGAVAISFLHIKAYPQFEKYIGSIKNKFNQTSYLNLAAGILSKDDVNLAYAETIAKKTVTLYESYKDDPLARPVNFPVEDWNRFMKMAAYPYYQAYAQALDANGKHHAAFLYQEKALKNIDLEQMEPTAVALYAKLLAAEGQHDNAYALLLKMAKLGKATTNMNEQLKRLYEKKVGPTASGDLFLDTIRANVAKSIEISLATEMINNVVAPDFTLANLEGKTVSLGDFKGKVVVIDFWATWCAPCIAAMPAMKNVSNRNPDVVFLFIATSETGNKPAETVKSYIQKFKFPTNVLMDKISEVANRYKVTGIPAKVVIDKQGKLRFSTQGFNSEAELTTELEAMITLAKAQ